MPRFMYVGGKPHTFVNEIHTIFCGLTSILWRYQIVEGKYPPQNIGQEEYNKSGKTVSLMLRMCRPIFGWGKAAVLNSVFCVSKGTTYIESKGVYEAALINIWHYWPKGVPFDHIDIKYENNEVSDVGMI